MPVATSQVLQPPRQLANPWTDLILEVINEQVVHGGDAVGPTDLLAFGVSAAVITDGHLIDAGAQLRQFDRDLGFNAKAIGADVDLGEQVATEDLVAGGYVVNAEAG